MWQFFIASSYVLAYSPGGLLERILPFSGWLYILLSVPLGYLLGSIPVGYLVSRRYGIDIREHGSGNIGATNVLRVLGKKPGYFVFLCDMLKGFLSARLAMWMVEAAARYKLDQVLRSSGIYDSQAVLEAWAEIRQMATLAGILGALCCILGHNFPVWLRFRGGKGVATTVGVLLGLMPAAFLVAAGVWIVSFYAFRYVSLASLLAAGSLPPAVWLLTRHADPASGGVGAMFWFSVVAAALVFLRHRTNIQRLLNGTESRFARRPKAHVDPAV